MTTRLPPELVEEVLFWAQLDQPNEQQQQTRDHFRLVCRDWRDSFVYWNQARVGDLDQLAGLAVTLTRDRLATQPGQPTKADQIRTLVVELGDDLGPAERNDLAVVLGMISAVERIELKLAGVLAARVAKALSKLVTVKYFNLDITVYFPIDNLHALVSDWPSLREVSVTNAELAPSDSQLDQILGANTKLVSVTLSDITGPVTYRTLINGLPTTVRELAVAGPELFEHVPPEVISTLEALAPQLERLTLSDMLEGYGGPRRPTVRGVYDSVVAKLTKVEKLSISPVGISNLSASLAPLANLAELEIGLGSAGCLAHLDAAEVTTFVQRAPATLKKLVIRAKLWKAWSQAEKRTLGSAALARGVTVILKQPPRPGQLPAGAMPFFLGAHPNAVVAVPMPVGAGAAAGPAQALWQAQSLMVAAIAAQIAVAPVGGIGGMPPGGMPPGGRPAPAGPAAPSSGANQPSSTSNPATGGPSGNSTSAGPGSA